MISVLLGSSACPRRTDCTATGNVSTLKPTHAGEAVQSLPAWSRRVAQLKNRSSIKCWPDRTTVSRLCPSGGIVGRPGASQPFFRAPRRLLVFWCIAPLHLWSHHRGVAAWRRTLRSQVAENKRVAGSMPSAVRTRSASRHLGPSPNNHMLRAVTHKVLGRGRVVAALCRAPRARVLLAQRTGADVGR